MNRNRKLCVVLCMSLLGTQSASAGVLKLGGFFMKTMAGYCVIKVSKGFVTTFSPKNKERLERCKGKVCAFGDKVESHGKKYGKQALVKYNEIKERYWKGSEIQNKLKKSGFLQKINLKELFSKKEKKQIKVDDSISKDESVTKN
ncbi:hypothetical protein KAH94_05505 [bacterium]|nr:hypothetical protein [bacterium]